MADEFEIKPGVVISVERGRAVVRMDKEEEDCGGCRSCALKSLCRGRDSAHVDIPVEVPEGGAPAPGDRVRVVYRAANPAKAAALLFLPALIGLFPGGWLANLVFGSGDGIFLAGCGAGMGAGLALTYGVERLFRSSGPETRLMEPEVCALSGEKLSKEISSFG